MLTINYFSFFLMQVVCDYGAFQPSVKVIHNLNRTISHTHFHLHKGCIHIFLMNYYCFLQYPLCFISDNYDFSRIPENPFLKLNRLLNINCLYLAIHAQNKRVFKIAYKINILFTIKGTLGNVLHHIEPNKITHSFLFKRFSYRKWKEKYENVLQRL